MPAALVWKGLSRRSRIRPINERTFILLRKKGLGLIPLLVEIVAWSGQLVEWQSVAETGTPEQIRQVKRFATTKNKGKIIQEIRDAVAAGSYFFAPR